MSYKIRKSNVHLRDEGTQVLLPIGMLAAGGDESLRDFDLYTEKTVNNAISTIETKKAEKDRTNYLQDNSGKSRNCESNFKNFAESKILLTSVTYFYLSMH